MDTERRIIVFQTAFLKSFLKNAHFKQEGKIKMTIKVGSIVSHALVLEWGTGKVLEVTSSMATVRFSDGKERKIASSHFSSLQPASADSYVPAAATTPEVKNTRIPKATTKKK
jgi:hypothetical protein